MSLSKCCICENLIYLESDVVTLKSKGVDSLINASKQRFDGKWLKFNETIKVHSKCRKDYTRPQSIKTNQCTKCSEEFTWYQLHLTNKRKTKVSYTRI